MQLLQKIENPSIKKPPHISLVYGIYFLYFSGYYIFIILLSNADLDSYSRNLTIPIRIVILFGLFIITRYRKVVKNQYHIGLFFAFALLYIVRIFIDIFYDHAYYLDKYEVLLYFLAFAALPFLLTGRYKFLPADYENMRNSILSSSLIFYILTLIFYKNVLGTAGRISNEITSQDQNYISPLTLSYCATLGIGVAISYWMANKVSLKQKIYFITIIAFATVPFFLGASRGSLFGLFIPFLFVFLFKEKATSRVAIIISVLAGAGLVFYLAEKFGSSLIDRFTTITDDINSGSSSAIRLKVWQQALTQFIDHPFFGDRLQITGYEMYAHNLFVEVLLTTGVFGFIPFLLLIVYTFKKAVRIIKHVPKFLWLCIIFIQSFIIGMFSGSLYTASWLWLSMGLILSFDIAGVLKQQKKLAV